MNLDSAFNTSSKPLSNQRKERGSIATQACVICRSRKQKCDEQRPKCALCRRMELECTYGKVQPIKKDKTLVEILDRLKSLEGKVDRIPTRVPIRSIFDPPQPSSASRPSFSSEVNDPSSYSASSLPLSQQPKPSGTGSQLYRHASAAHNMLTWPAIQQLLVHALPSIIEDLKSLELEGSAFIVRMQKGTPGLPQDEALPNRPFVGIQTQATRTLKGARVIFPALTWDRMHDLATAYFDTFNFIYPFMDRHNFMSDTILKVYTEGFDDHRASVIALLVFALGELAKEGSRGDPIEEYMGRPSGVRGGTSSRPPGLALFNEARKRIGFFLTECDLDNIQIFSLAALYYGSCSRHVDFWRLTVSASLACQVLVTCDPIDWNSPRGDLIKRVYWHCVIMETGLHLELDLPLTGITGLQDRVGIPIFNSPFDEDDHWSNQLFHLEAYYTSQFSLRHIYTHLHDNINNSITNTDTPTSSNSDFGGPTASSLNLLALQLTRWRGMLPQCLQWDEDNPAGIPTPQPLNLRDQPLDPTLSIAGYSGPPLFISDLDKDPVHYPYAYDIQVALLRTRYYYAKYLVHKPFVYKALHFPEQMTQEDAKGAAECLLSCLNWPLLLSPTSRRKRLIPYLFCWSQNLLDILLIVHMTQHNPMLRDIRAQLCGPRFEAEVDQTVELMVDWIRDLKSSDTIAMWCWQILQGIDPRDP